MLRRRWSSKAWIVCYLHYKGARRTPMAARSWTELFFLDEATALAAGHRPCFLCRRDAAEAFRAAWSRAPGASGVRASEIDEVLHRERLDRGRKRLAPLSGAPAELPTGAMVASGDVAFLIAFGAAYAWTPAGYGPPTHLGGADGLLTPASSLEALRAGYTPDLHPSSGVRSEATAQNRFDTPK